MNPCEICGKRYCTWHAVGGRPVAAWPAGLAVLLLGGLLLAAQGSPGWQDQPTVYVAPVASWAAGTVPVPTPEASR